MTEEEIKLFAGRPGNRSLEEAEQDMVSGVFRWANAGWIHDDPRTEMVWIDLDDERETIIREVIEIALRIPVARELDEVVGAQ